MKKLIALLLSSVLALSLAACGNTGTPAQPEESTYENARTLVLDGDTATLDGAELEVFDYTWHCDPSAVHDEVDNAPAEYYTGTKPDTDAAAYIDHELYYFPALDESSFRLVNYDGENEWAYYYTDGENNDYIFATLPQLGNSLPTQMMHTEAEAAENQVLHITEPGTYILQGEWNGQIWVDLGDKDETFTDPDAKVTLVLDGADINCTVAPGIVFYSAYECDNGWEYADTHAADVSTDDAGVTVIVADDTENSVSGTNVFRMLKTKYKSDDDTSAVKVQKKMRKTDGALYSYVSMNICGEAENTGVLTVNSGFEGIDSELHLNFMGGNITVNSQDDGVNVNEDDVSVVLFTGSTVTLNAARGAEGDGVDSNGYIVLNDGTVSVNGVVAPDSALDSEDGITYYAGTVIIDGTEQSYAAGDVFRETGGVGGGFGGGMGEPMMGDPNRMAQNFDLEKFKKDVAELDDDATLNDVLSLLGWGERQPGSEQMPDMGQRPDLPQGGQMPPEKPADIPQ